MDGAAEAVEDFLDRGTYVSFGPSVGISGGGSSGRARDKYASGKPKVKASRIILLG